MGKVTDDRLLGLHKWVQTTFPCDQSDIKPLAGDASFRRYFRVQHNGETRIIVDSPPANEKSAEFIAIAQALATQNIQVPIVIASDLKQGYLLLSDLGDELYHTRLNSTNVDQMYLAAIDTLIKIQQTSRDSYAFPAYSEALLLTECNLFAEWYISQHLKLKLSAREDAVLKSTFGRLIEEALEQPTTLVHRDYHSRNLLVLADKQVGVLDFQDAVIGPITYDLVSLLKDCYIAWPASNVTNWVQRYFEKARDAGVISDITMPQFLRWFDLMGVQRHLKCMGIFARLYLRDGKPDYLGHLPLILDYILGVSARHPQLNGLAKLLQSKVLKHESNDTRSRTRKSAATINE